MFKEEKNVITKEKIESDLRFYAKSTLIGDVTILGIVSFFMIPLAILSVVALVDTTIWYLGVVFALAFLLPVIILSIGLAKSAIYYAGLTKYGFEIIESEVTKKIKDDTPPKGSKYNINALYFGKYGRIAAGGVSFQMSSEGDKFYLVIPKWEKCSHILAAYSQKMYEIV